MKEAESQTVSSIPEIKVPGQIMINDREFTSLRNLLHEQAGVFMPPSKKTLMQNRLRKRLQTLGLKSYGEYHRYLTMHKEEMSHFLDALTTNETFFLREEKHWDFLKQTILPPIVEARRSGVKNFSVWSAASSTGEELYTVAMLLLESLPESETWTLKLVGTDINTEVLEKAKVAEYKDYAVRMLPKHLYLKYFDQCSNDRATMVHRLRDKAKRHCKFQRHNLQHPFGQKNFDLVLCRNVFIYFDKESKERVMGNLVNSMAKGGYLFFSHTEAMVPRLPQLEQVRPSIYRKVE